MVESFIGVVGVLAFESERAFFRFKASVLAVLRDVSVLVSGSPEVLGSMCVNAGGPVVFDIFLWTVCRFVSVHIKHFLVHREFLGNQVLRVVSLRLVRHIERHYKKSVTNKNWYWTCFSSGNL